MRRVLVFTFLAVLLISASLVIHRKVSGAEVESVREVTVAPAMLTNLGFALTLRAHDSEDRIEMVVGFLEGNSIEMARRGEKAERPLTHDIFKTFLDRNGWKVDRVVVRDLVNGTFLADLVFTKDGQKQVYDARPSDAIALALRSGTKIYVAQKVFDLQKEEDKKQTTPERRRPKPNVT